MLDVVKEVFCRSGRTKPKLNQDRHQADLTVVQKTIIDTLHKEGKPQTLIAKEAGCSQIAVSKHVNRMLRERKKCERKRCTTNRENRSLMRIVKKN